MKKQLDDKGFSLVEMVVAVGVLSLFMPILVQMMVVTVTARDTVMTTSHNNISATSMTAMLESDVEKTSAYRQWGTSRDTSFRIMRNDGMCVAWKTESGKLMRATTDESKLTKTWAPTASNWVTIYDKVAPVGTTATFNWDDDLNLNYKLSLGDDSAKSIVEGKTTSKVIANGGKGYCW